MPRSVLSPAERAFLAAARRAVLATTAPDGHARLVPICFVLDPSAAGAAPPVAWSPIDEKPKTTADPLQLARVRDIRERPGVTLLVDRWSEDWSELAWLRCTGSARLEDLPAMPDRARGGIIHALRTKYPQYRQHALEDRPLLRIEIERVTSWGRLEP